MQYINTVLSSCDTVLSKTIVAFQNTASLAWQNRLSVPSVSWMFGAIALSTSRYGYCISNRQRLGCLHIRQMTQSCTMSRRYILPPRHACQRRSWETRWLLFLRAAPEQTLSYMYIVYVTDVFIHELSRLVGVRLHFWMGHPVLWSSSTAVLLSLSIQLYLNYTTAFPFQTLPTIYLWSWNSIIQCPTGKP